MSAQPMSIAEYTEALDAEQADWEAEVAAQFDREHAAVGDTGPAYAYPPTPQNWNDSGLTSHQRIARRFATYAEGRALYVDGTGWHYWDGSRWAPDHHSAQAHKLLSRLLNISWTEAITDKALAGDVRSAMTATGSRGVLELASRQLFAIETDTDPWLLNCANGTLDLRTLELRDADPRDLITKQTRAAYEPGAQSSRWNDFLESSLPDVAVRDFLQRYAGMSLIGRVLEHVLVVATGTGRNGKSVLAEALANTFGDYAVHAANDLLIASRHGGKSAGELAQMMQLRGARWAVMSEIERGSKLAESTMKALTGGDTINAKHMGQNPITFVPSHSFFMLTNDLPEVDPRAQAVWARLRVVPFEVSFEGREDTTLTVDLETQLEAILCWAVEGLAKYQQQGRLTAPTKVLATTDQYRDQNDALTQFLAEECVIGSGAVTKEDFDAAYLRWQLANKKDSLTPNMLSRRMKSLIEDRPETYGGITRTRSNGGTFVGLRLAEQAA